MHTRYWLIKTEPSAWSWQDQVKAGKKGTAWSGVRNHLAKKNLMEMQKGDRCFFYHTGDDKEIVGICEVTKAHYPDPTAAVSEPWIVVDVAAAKPLPSAVTLAVIKAKPELTDMVLVKSARLSVQPVTKKEWDMICRMGGLS